MKRTKLVVGLGALTLAVAGMFSFKPAKKFAPLTQVYAPGYGYLFGNSPAVNWTGVKGTSGHTAFFKTISGSLVTLRSSSSGLAGNAYIH
jgi:hypothetical protein